MSNIIYYFSGTGNSLSIARKVAENLGNTEVVSIMTLRENSKIPPKYNKVGFSIPTCFAHPTKVVTSIGETVQFTPEQKVFVIATAGAGNGRTLFEFCKLMQEKTKNPVQSFFLKLPPNHIVGFSPFPSWVQQIRFRKEKKTAIKIAKKILASTPTKRLKEMNLKWQRKLSEGFNARLGIKDIYSTKAEFYTTDACIRCGVCEKICKVGNIKASKDNVTFGDNCQQCMACIQWCPQKAIAHPNVPANRRRYHHPDITLDDMLK